MTLEQLYYLWKIETYNGLLCIHSNKDNHPYCLLESHSSVKFGCDKCPNKCPDFKEDTEKNTYKVFLSLYKKHKDEYNAKYHINVSDEDLSE